MSELLRDPFGRLREHPNFVLCLYATEVFKHIQNCENLNLWWNRYGPLYQGVTINGRDNHGIEGSPHFYKRFTITMDPSDDSSDEDEEMSDADGEDDGEIIDLTKEETNDEERGDSCDDDMSYEASNEESSDDEDNRMSYAGSIEPDVEIIDLTKDDD